MRVLSVILVVMTTSAAATAMTITVGETDIELPTPRGFAPVTQEMMPFFEHSKQVVTGANIEYVSFISEDIVPAVLRGEIPPVARRISVQTVKRLAPLSLTPSDFAEIKNVAVNSLGSKGIREQTAEKIENLEFSDNPAARFQLLQTVPLGAHAESDCHISSAQFTQYSVTRAGGATQEFVAVLATTLLYVNGKVLNLHVYAEEGGLDWARKTSERWVKSILTANELNPETGGYGYFRSLVAVIDWSDIGAGVVAVVILSGGAVFLVLVLGRLQAIWRSKRSRRIPDERAVNNECSHTDTEPIEKMTNDRSSIDDFGEHAEETLVRRPEAGGTCQRGHARKERHSDIQKLEASPDSKDTEVTAALKSKGQRDSVLRFGIWLFGVIASAALAGIIGSYVIWNYDDASRPELLSLQITHGLGTGVVILVVAMLPYFLAAMISGKLKTIHRSIGLFVFWIMAIVAVTTFVVSGARHSSELVGFDGQVSPGDHVDARAGTDVQQIVESEIRVYENWRRVRIPDLGSIAIPPSMEVRSPELARRFGTTYDLVIQQKNLNRWTEEARSRYVRIMFEVTYRGDRGELAKIGEKISYSGDDLDRISESIRDLAVGPNMEIVEFWEPVIVRLGRAYAVKQTYRRVVGSNPPARVSVYVVEDDDCLHSITVSYRESEEHLWLKDIQAALDSLVFD